MKNSNYRPIRIGNSLSLFCTWTFLLLGISCALGETQNYAIDPAHSSVEFRIRHFFTNVAGRFDQFAGTIQFDDKTPEKSQIQATIDTSSINTNQSDRDKHLRTADYFDVEKFPKMIFESKSWKKLSDANYEVTGDLTLHGVTKVVILSVKSLGFGPGVKGVQISGWAAAGKIKCSDFRMTAGAPAVGDEVSIEINVEAKKL